MASKDDLENLPTKDDLEKMQEKLTQMQWHINANGHEFVDLGLSVLWATCNVGAEKPEENGKLFAWGETVGYYFDINTADENVHSFKDDYDKDLYDIFDEVETTENGLDPDYDAASQNWGGKWRMPSQKEFEELIENCNRKLVNGSNPGCWMTSKFNEKRIFLPCAGSSSNSNKKHGEDNEESNFGFYWSRDLDRDDSKLAYILKFNYFGNLIFSSDKNAARSNGLTVRGVLDK